MNTEMRLIKQKLSTEAAKEILNNGTSGVLSLLGPDGYPYGLPISYVVIDDQIYFHGAKAGYKYKCIENCDKACFTVVGMEKTVPEEYTAYYKSVIVFGRISVVKDSALMRSVIEKLAIKYVPNDGEKQRNEAIDREWPALGMFEMDIEEITGKQSM